MYKSRKLHVKVTQVNAPQQMRKFCCSVLTIW